MIRKLIKILLGAAGWLLVSCAPLFSDLQGARLVGKEQFELTPGYSSVGFAADNASKEGVASYLGFQFAYGLTENIDLRLRFERCWLKGSFPNELGNEVSYNIVALGPKINLARNRVALFLPVGTVAGLVQFQPTFLFTIPLISNKIDLNPSVKHIIDICSSCWEPLFAVNTGLALSSDLRRWAFLVEYGRMYNLDAGGHYSNLSMGFSFNFSNQSRP